MPMLVEICVDGLENALSAAAAGADRIELCADLPRDGTTPSTGVLAIACDEISIPVHVLIRPRPGHFVYTPAEARAMLQDIAAARFAAASGVVVGALNNTGYIDLALTRDLIAAAKPLAITFHRAFDHVTDPFKALDQLAELGVDRVLTSGRPGHARDHLTLLGQMMRHTAGRLILLAAGGIIAADLPALAAVGIREVHAGSAAVGPDGRIAPGRVQALLAVARNVEPAAP